MPAGRWGGRRVPAATARAAWSSNPKGTPAMWIRDRLDGLFTDKDLEDWFPCAGRPGLSPAVLALICVLQFAENLTDRQAALAVSCRIDWKYCLGMSLDDTGFDHSVLSEFRDRLAEGDRADALLRRMVDRPVDAGLLKTRGKVRTDSTHVLAAARTLNRPKLVTETHRVALEAPAEAAPSWLAPLIDAEWGRRYGRAARYDRLPKDKDKLAEHVLRVGPTACAYSRPWPNPKHRCTSNGCHRPRCCDASGSSNIGPTSTGNWPGVGRRIPRTG